MIKDKMSEIYEALMSDEELSKVTIKSFERPETLKTNQTSIVIIPLGPPTQSDQGSNTSFSKTFLYQINVESTNRIECKEGNGITRILSNRWGPR